MLDDTISAERTLGVDAGLAWGQAADLTAVYIDLGITPGMSLGIERALREGRPVQHRTLDHWRPH